MVSNNMRNGPVTLLHLPAALGQGMAVRHGSHAPMTFV